MKKNVLIVVANPSEHPTLHYPVGFWASELFHPISVFNNSDIDWDIASPAGGQVIMDPMSNPNDSSQYSAWDALSKKFVDDAVFMKQLENTKSLDAINPDDYDAIMVAGGQSPMFTFEGAKNLHKLFLSFYESGKVAAALCHGVAVLNFITDASGQFLVANKQITGFTNAEEDQANAAVNAVVMPWRIEDELIKKGAIFKKSEAWKPFAIVDGNLITGQQNMSGEITAQKIVEQLKI
ncbi:type 1 glutamine amidotransferase domain-containing protein [Gaetbulibacter aestuarii]|uniref:Type 1 glutamine amidotransferase domain-containing protein n=1 Tax=Gaetbulibacter aestuarii TaxID=1502358 RepID=A0ABW7MZ00_9FLAO